MQITRSFVAGIAMLTIGVAGAAAETTGGSPAALRAKYASLQSDLEHSAFGRPLHLVSSNNSADALTGDIHAIIEHPFGQVRTALSNVKNWCDIMVLHPNITNCRSGPNSLTIVVGRGGAPVEFDFKVPASQSEYMHIDLRADEGPLGTKDFRIMLEATPLDEQRTFVHLTCSQGFGTQAQLAMRAYLSTLGRNKVGFTVVGKTRDGKPQYIGDFRGALERNAMRYYLAIEAYLDSPQQFEKRLQSYYTSAERYPLQLHESQEYLDSKRKIAQGAG